ncbi:bifunctional lysylphosphatidylglycerol flippase/synthetase MprF [Falsihalocynthiibacter sp. S25ZX9]
MNLAEETTPSVKSSHAKLHHMAPIILGFGMFFMGAYALYNLLSSVNIGHVRQQAASVPISHIAASVLATGVGYFSLIGYDWSALRYLGKRLPFPVVMMGGFLGYSFGNTIGFSAISGGAVRYRIYSAFGLNAFDVAAISTFVTLAFSFGITLVGLAALAIHPAALGDLLPWSRDTVRIAATLAFLVPMGILTWLSVTGKVAKFRRITVSMPSPSILFSQLGFSIVDTSMAALTLYILMPTGTPDFITFIALFAAAALIGVASHVPGGIGVFESIILAGLPDTVPLDQAVAALLLFRVIYYLLPFALSVVFVSAIEGRLASGFLAKRLGPVSSQMEPAFKVVASVAPVAAGFTGFAVGIYLLLAAVVPASRKENIDPDDLLSIIFLEGGAYLSAALGLLLIVLAQGLFRRMSGAFWLTLAVLSAGAIVSTLTGADWKETLLLVVSAAVLWPLRREFFRATKLTQGMFTWRWIALLAALLVSIGGFILLLHQAVPYSHELLGQFSGDARLPRTLRTGLFMAALSVLILVYLLLQPARTRGVVVDEVAMKHAERIIALAGQPEGCLALTGDKTLFFSKEMDAFIMYAVQGRSWIAYGDPIGPKGAIPELAWDFFDSAYSANCRPVFYEISTKYLPLWVEIGLTLHKMGEEAVVDLTTFSLAGGDFRKMRAAHNKAVKSGLKLEILHPPHSAESVAALKEVSDAWLGEKHATEKGFSVGQFTAEYLAHFPIAVVKREDRILAFANVMSPGDLGAVSIDLMRYLPQEADGMIEFLFIKLMEHYREKGAQTFSLGMAPLSGLEARHGTRMWNRVASIIYRHGGAFYSFEGLRGFKKKFHPQWQPRYMAVPGGLQPIIALRDVTLLISGGAKRLWGK